MNLPRNRYFDALETLVKTVADFKLVSRRMKLYHECNVAQDFPAMFIMSPTEQYSRELGEGVPSRVVIEATIFIYLAGGKDISASAVPMNALNDIMDKVDDVLKPNPLTAKQTLGGIVSHCWIEGEVIKEPGDLDGEGIIAIPIKMLVP